VHKDEESGQGLIYSFGAAEYHRGNPTDPSRCKETSGKCNPEMRQHDLRKVFGLPRRLSQVNGPRLEWARFVWGMNGPGLFSAGTKTRGRSNQRTYAMGLISQASGIHSMLRLGLLRFPAKLARVHSFCSASTTPISISDSQALSFPRRGCIPLRRLATWRHIILCIREAYKRVGSIITASARDHKLHNT